MNSGQRRKHHRHCLREFGMAPTQLREYCRYMNDGTQFGLRPGEILPVFIFQKPGKTFRYEEPSDEEWAKIVAAGDHVLSINRK